MRDWLTEACHVVPRAALFVASVTAGVAYLTVRSLVPWGWR